MNSFRNPAEDHVNVTPMIGRTVSTARPSFQLIRQQQNAGADDQNDRRDERRHGLRDEHFHGVESDVRFVSSVAGVTCWMKVVILREILSTSPRPQVPRDALGTPESAPRSAGTGRRRFRRRRPTVR